MAMITNLKGRVLHTDLPKSNSLIPLFEAVVNSIHGIEDTRMPIANGRIVVEIIRSGQLTLQETDSRLPPIEGFLVTDNGVGFTDKNFEAFETLDTDNKMEKGCRGVGRLMWLKAFSSVEVVSSYKTSDGLMQRSFRFSLPNGVTGPTVIRAPENVTAPSTSIRLTGWDKKHQEAAPKSTDVIADKVFEHCLWYLVRDQKAPNIVIRDDKEAHDLDRTYSAHVRSMLSKTTAMVKGKAFEVTHIKLRKNALLTHTMALCAAGRLAKVEGLRGKIPGLYGSLSDEEGTFFYSCYVTSPYLDQNVRSERTGFSIEEKYEGIFAETHVSMTDIREAIVKEAEEYLAPMLGEHRRRGRERIESFTASKAPKYRPILAHIPPEQLSVDPDISDKDLDLLLHRHLADIESRLLAEGHDILTPKANEKQSAFKARVRSYLATVDDVKKSDLASYVSHRRVIIDLLSEALKRGEDGKYSKEDLIHEFIMPLRTDSNENRSGDCNLWLVDERLAFHDYLASDKPLTSMPITDSSSGTEPDICALNVFDNRILVTNQTFPPFAALTIIEIKRPMRNDMTTEERDPVEQAMGYLKRIREGRVTTAKGRPLGDAASIPGYCYVIADLTATLKDRCENTHDLKQTADGLGYFGYKGNLRCYIEVISFDRLVNGAKERNRAFFDKLGLPTT